MIESSSGDDNVDYGPKVRDTQTTEPLNVRFVNNLYPVWHQIGGESREQTPQSDPEGGIEGRQAPPRPRAPRREHARPNRAPRLTRRFRRRPRASRYNEKNLLKHFTRPRLPRLVKRNAAEFFEQVRKMGQQPGHVGSSSPSPSPAGDSRRMNPDGSEPVFGTAESEDAIPADANATHPFSPSLVQCADAVASSESELDLRPAVKVGDTLYKVWFLLNAKLLLC